MLPESGMVGQSAALYEMIKVTETYARKSDNTILIIGEPGSGKELVAWYIHKISKNPEQPFISAHMGAIPGGLYESHLFGHKAGSFTDAKETTAGYMGEAGQGVLFLDEIGTMPYSAQPKLLRVLESGSYMPVGGAKRKRLEARVLCATNLNLEEAVRRGDFRQDLYDRITRLVIRVPPLRERLNDVPLLANYFLEMTTHSSNINFSEDLIARLQQYDYPGNVRELRNLVEGMALLLGDDQDTITTTELDLVLKNRSLESSTPKLQLTPDLLMGLTYKEAMDLAAENIARLLIPHALQQTNGNITKAAELLGMSPKTLANIRKKFDID